MVEIENFYVFRGVSFLGCLIIFCCIENNKSTTTNGGVGYIYFPTEKRSGVNKIVYNINTDFLVFPLFPFIFSTTPIQRFGEYFRRIRRYAVCEKVVRK